MFGVHYHDRRFDHSIHTMGTRAPDGSFPIRLSSLADTEGRMIIWCSHGPGIQSSLSLKSIMGTVRCAYARAMVADSPRSPSGRFFY